MNNARPDAPRRDYRWARGELESHRSVHWEMADKARKSVTAYIA